MPLVNPLAKTDIYGFQTLHREIGYYISKLEQYDKSLKFFDEAIRKTPDDKRALIGRSRARSKVIQYEGALEDVNRALSLDPDDLVVLADRALNTYLCCEFEDGLVKNMRVLPKRQKPDNFKMGVMQCSDAIENCLGDRAGKPLRDHFQIIRRLAWKKNYAAQKPFEPKPTNMPKRRKKIMLSKLLEVEGVKEPVQPKHVKRQVQTIPEANKLLNIRDSLHSVQPDNEPIPKCSKPFPFRPLQHHTTNIENYIAEKYLDAMYLDKIFLKKLQKEPGAKSPNKEGTKKIHQLAKNCFKNVSYKQELLRTRRPFYFIKYQEARVSGALKERQKCELANQQQQVKNEADILSFKMLEAFEKKDLRSLLDVVEKLKRFCDTKPTTMLPTKNDYMNEIYDKVCSAFYDMYRVNKNHSQFQQTKRIYCMLGVPLSRPPSADSVVDQFKNVFLDYKKKISEFSLRLENATTEEEICWYYHELSRFEYESNHYDLSRLYAKKCIKEARQLGNEKWVFNSTMMMLKNNLAEHNKNDAKNDLLVAMNCVQKLQDPDKIDFIEQCQDVVDHVEFEDLFGSKQLEKRENRIIQMMTSSKMKDEVAHLFRQMAAMPASRRMTVMPGVRVENKGTQRVSAKARTMSIMPASRDNEIAPTKVKSGLKEIFDLHV